MDINFSEIEDKWKDSWEKSGLYTVTEDASRPKYYVLDMFPYPSGAGLHVGHPLGYVASDIVARYKRLQGFNVLHPMGFDAFGLPAEQYAIETGTHPAITTAENIKTYREQLKKIGFSYDWKREVQTSDPSFYKWTQWIFMQLFNAWFDKEKNKAAGIETLVEKLEKAGSMSLADAGLCAERFDAAEWKQKTTEEQQAFLMQFRLAYLDHAEVWWCEGLGTVLANDEVKDGVSERGGHPVEKIRMRQWFLRITDYADRLLEGLDTLDWSESMKEMQRNWIGRSEGASVHFSLKEHAEKIEVFTTRPDTIFGATFMVLAPEHDLVANITSPEQKEAVEQYISYVKTRSERDRQSEVKKVTGQFTGAYAVNPFTGKDIPIYIAEYVLAGYGTGAIMAVPSNDERDKAFAEKFGIDIISVVDQSAHPNAGPEDKVGFMKHSGFLDGLEVHAAIARMLDEIESKGIGKRKVNFRLRDAGFSRQRYWGEPFPVIYRNDTPYLLDEAALPLELPEVQEYKPGGQAKSPLAALTDWVNLPDGAIRETDTMPGYAGSSWYFLRYMDPNNPERFVGEAAEKYWRNVDLYIGGTEHAVGHLLYSRLLQKFLFDKGLVSEDEPFKKLVNQGMIQGVSSVLDRTILTAELIEVYNIVKSKLNTEIFLSQGIAEQYKKGKVSVNELLKKIDAEDPIFGPEYITVGEPEIESIPYSNDIRFPIEFVDGDVLDVERYKAAGLKHSKAIFVRDEDRKFRVGHLVEKMSKSKYNVENPNDVIAQYGADCFRMYEMFLGPIDASKPWDTKGITGVSGFLRKFGRLFMDEEGGWKVTETAADTEALKVLHKCILKVTDDIERLSFNTAVSAFMIATNSLTDLKCTSREVLEPMLILLAPFAPFVTEELWSRLGHENSVHTAAWPEGDESLLVENSFTYPVSINGKVRASAEYPLDMPAADLEKSVLALEAVLKWTEGKAPRKIIIVPGRIINIVI